MGDGGGMSQTKEVDVLLLSVGKRATDRRADLRSRYVSHRRNSASDCSRSGVYGRDGGRGDGDFACVGPVPSQQDAPVIHIRCVRLTEKHPS
jgi:hypothetical protein